MMLSSARLIYPLIRDIVSVNLPFGAVSAIAAVLAGDFGELFSFLSALLLLRERREIWSPSLVSGQRPWPSSSQRPLLHRLISRRRSLEVTLTAPRSRCERTAFFLPFLNP